MSRRKPEARCPACRLRAELCLCAEIAECRAQLRVRTRIEVLMHHREAKLPTNTAHLASLISDQCRIHLRGLPGQPLAAEQLFPDRSNTLLLYPSDDSRELNAELLAPFGDATLTVIVPDGSWRQASKVAQREAYLHAIPRVHLPADLPTRYRLRREPKAGGLATYEAIARCLGLIEGPRVRQKMEELFDQFVERSLAGRGQRSPA